MTTTATPTDDPVREDQPLPIVLIGLGEMASLFPDVTPQTVYRWRVSRGGADPVLPAPLVTVSKTPMWSEDMVTRFAKDRGLRLDRKALSKIRKAQGR